MADTIEAIKDVDELSRRIADILVKWPLYREFRYAGNRVHIETPASVYSTSTTHGRLPKVIVKECGICNAVLSWDLDGDPSLRLPGSPDVHTYVCRNCRNTPIAFAIRWVKTEAGGVFFKFGELPAPERRPPKELRANLQPEDLEFYTRALECRHFNYGLAALGYMRRVIENRIDDILDLAYRAAKAEGIPAPDLHELETAKRSRQFTDKLDLAKKLIPRRLQPEGLDPIGELYDSASSGIHRHSEDECIDIFDRGRLTFEHIFTELKHDELKTEQFIQELRALQTKQKGGEPGRD